MAVQAADRPLVPPPRPMVLVSQTDTGNCQMVFYVASGMAFRAAALALVVLEPLRARADQ